MSKVRVTVLFTTTNVDKESEPVGRLTVVSPANSG